MMRYVSSGLFDPVIDGAATEKVDVDSWIVKKYPLIEYWVARDERGRVRSYVTHILYVGAVMTT
jgi:hypothetical protein